MGISHILIGVAVGAGAMYAVKKYILDISQVDRTKRVESDLNAAKSEIQRLRKRDQSQQAEIDRLESEISAMRRKSSSKSDDLFELEDTISRQKRDLKSITYQNEQLTKSLNEYKSACENYEIELRNIKNR